MIALKYKTIEILLVEDNAGDVLLAREALDEARVSCRLNVVSDGVEAIDFLLRRGNHQDAPPADLVLLDLNLPRKNGRDVINEMLAHPSLHLTPLVVLTSSRHDQDVLDGYDPVRSMYIVKPSHFEALVGVMKQVEQFWLAMQG